MDYLFIGFLCGIALYVVYQIIKSTGNNGNANINNSSIQDTGNANSWENTKITTIDIPIEVLPNVYSLSVRHQTIKYKKETFNSGKTYESISLDCEMHYKLNGRNEGKRRFVFSFYDENGNLVSHTESKAYLFTTSGIEIVHTENYVSWKDIPKKIGVSVQEYLKI